MELVIKKEVPKVGGASLLGVHCHCTVVRIE